MASSPNLLPLKILVISLGIALIGGIVFICSVIATRASADMTAALHCQDTSIKLNVHDKATVLNVVPQGNRVQITLSSQGKVEVLTMDRCSGKVLQTLSIEP